MSIAFAGHNDGRIRLTGGLPSTNGLWILLGSKPTSPLPARFQALIVLAAWSGPGSPTAHVLGITTDDKWQLFTNFGNGASGTYPDGVSAKIGTAVGGAWQHVALRCAAGVAELVLIDLATETLTKAAVGQVAFTPTELIIGANTGEGYDGKIAPIRVGSGTISDAQLIAQAKSLTAVSGQGTAVVNKSGIGANLADILTGDLGGAFVVATGGESYVSADSDAPEYAEPSAGDNVFELGGELDLRPQASITSATSTGQTVSASGVAASYDDAAAVVAQLLNASTGAVVLGVTLEMTIDGDTWSASASGVPAGSYRVRLTVTDAIGTVAVESSNFTVASGVTVPGAPTLGTPEVLGPYSVGLSWTLPDGHGAEIRVYRKTSPGGARTLMATLPAGTLEYTASGLLASTAYYFDVGAWNTAGETRSAEQSATTMASTATAVLSVSPTSLAQPGSVTATLADPAGSTLTSATFFVNGVAAGPPDTESPFSISIPLTATDNGQVIISAVGVDALSRNITSSPVIVTVAIETLPDPDPGEEELTDEQVLALLANPIDPKFADEALPYCFDFRAELQTGETLDAIEYVEVEVRGPGELDPDAAAMLEGDPELRSTLGIVLQRVQAGKPGVAYYLRCQTRTSFDRVINAELAIRVHATTGRRAVRL